MFWFAWVETLLDTFGMDLRYCRIDWEKQEFELGERSQPGRRIA